MNSLTAWFLNWGATGEEVQGVMAGDASVTRPSYQTTLGVTIDAAPAQIWPWLVQMGYRRGGLYSYDWLDRLFGYLDAPSAEQILPQWQTLAVGDVIPIGRGGGFPVRSLEPLTSLVLAGEAPGFAWSWELALVPVSRDRTRLLSRNRARTPHTIGAAAFMWVLAPAAFVMTRRMLLGVKRRSEKLSATLQRAA